LPVLGGVQNGDVAQVTSCQGVGFHLGDYFVAQIFAGLIFYQHESFIAEIPEDFPIF
jgi:hypothetical protein